MLQAGVDGADREVWIEIGDQRLPVAMIVGRVRTELRPSARVRTLVLRQGRYTMILMAVALVRMITMSRPRVAAE